MAEKQWQGGTAPMVDDLGNGGHVPLVKLVNPSAGAGQEAAWEDAGYVLDLNGELISETQKRGSATRTRTWTYSYDLDGNTVATPGEWV